MKGLTDMRRSIATVSLSGTLPEKIDAIAAAGFDGIELFEPDFTHYAGSAHDLRALCDERGLAIELFQPFRDFEGMPAAQHRRNLERAERKFDLMSALGVRLMLVCSNTSPLALPDVELAAAQLRELARRAAARGIRIGYEALAWGRHVKLWHQAWRGRCAAPTRMSGWCSTVSTRCRDVSMPSASPICRATRSSSCRLPTRRAST